MAENVNITDDVKETWMSLLYRPSVRGILQTRFANPDRLVYRLLNTLLMEEYDDMQTRLFYSNRRIEDLEDMLKVILKLNF